MEKLTRAMSIKMMSFMETDRGGPGGAEAFVDRLTLWWNLFVCGWSYICTHYFLERMLHALGTSNCFLYYLIWIHSLTRPDLTQECLAGSNWRPSSAIHACAVWWPGMDLSDNTWGESTSVPGSRKLGMNINQSCCPIRSDSIVDLCLEENAVSLTQHMLMRRFGLAVWKSGNLLHCFFWFTPAWGTQVQFVCCGLFLLADERFDSPQVWLPEALMWQKSNDWKWWKITIFNG